MKIIKLQINKLANQFERAYQAVREKLGLDDSTETRQVLAPFLGVATCVVLYYVLAFVSKVFILATQASETAIAIIKL